MRNDQMEEQAARRVSDVMTSSPVAVSTDATASEAARRMMAENVGSLPVVENEALVGIVTDRDLVANVMARGLDADEVRVADCCSGDPVVARSDEMLDEALSRMAQEQVRRLPVVDDGRLVGIVAQADVARAAEPASTGAMVQRISSD